MKKITTSNFFEKKNEWSKIKDDLLGHYLKLYFSKIFMTGKHVYFIDCFAGKGRFDDGEPGSPLIALTIAEEAVANSRNKSADYTCFFIENKYSVELSDTIGNRKAKVFKGQYQDKIEELLNKCLGHNVFLYVDPFGIKSLYFDRFEILKRYRFNSIELLLNLNSFGFLREGCRLLKYKDFEEINIGFDERESIEVVRTTNDIPNMDRVANGDYWQRIVADYNNGILDAFEAEEQFVQEYCKQLSGIFAAIINVPIKARRLKNMPKYRMVFGTNHKHGLIEMADNMMRRWKQMREAEQSGQQMLFEMDINFRGEFVEFDYKKIILDLLNNEFVKFDDFICNVVLKYGVLCEIGKIKENIKEMENSGQIEIIRTPEFTETGKPAKWIDWKFDNNKKKCMKLRLRP